ncbi:sugar transferase [Leptolyngbya sp. NIES-3755]|nr:sugar transferase [Leptolyngbya sp. NIES-3755]
MLIPKPISSSRQPPFLGRDLRAPTWKHTYKAFPIKGLRVVTLIVLDAIALGGAWHLATHFSTPWSSFWAESIALLLVLGIEFCVLMAGGFYQPGESRRNYLGLIRTLTIAEVLLWLVAYFYQPSQFISRSHFVLFWVLSVLFVVIERYVIDVVLHSLRQRGMVRYAVLLIADPDEQKRSISLIERENRYNLVQVLSCDALDAESRSETFEIVQNLGISEVFVSWSAIKERLFLSWQFQSLGIVLNVIPSGFESLFQGSKFWTMRSFPALSFSPPTITGSDFWIKRGFDICLAFVLLIVLFPIYSLIAIAIKLDSPGSIFYRQVRIGLHGQPFKAWKFRTMVENADQLQQHLEAQNEMKDGILFKLKDDPRITRLGRFLRRSSLDELPQLINVVLGEMSLVGPRPLPVRDVEKFLEHHLVRQEVLPGITGLWQVSGRSSIENFEEVIQLDLTYIQNWSLGLDLAILLKTVQVVLCKTGAY